MLSPRWRKVVRDVWLHKPRTLLVVLAISIGIIGAGTVLNTWSLMRVATRDEFRDSNPASATLRTDSIDATLLARVRAMPAIANAQGRHSVVASARTAAGWRTAMLMTTDDFASNRIGIIKQEEGVWPPPGGALVVERSSREFAGVAVGDTLAIQFGDAAPVALQISGIARDVGLAPGWMEHVVYIFVTPTTLSRLGGETALNQLQIVVRDRSMDRESVRRVALDVQDIIESTGRRVTAVDVPVPGRHIHAAQIDSLLYTQGAFGLLALLLSAFLVVNLISAMLTGQVREIGVMKAVGGGAGQIAAMYLGLALLLGLVACAVALPVAALLGRAYAEFTAGMLNFDIAGAAIPRWVLALQLAVGALLPVAAAAIPVTHGSRISVADALRDVGMSGDATKLPRHSERKGLLERAGISRPLLLSLRNAFRKRQRMVLTLLTLATGGAVYLGATNLRASIIGSVDLLFESQRFDMVMRFARAYPVDSVVLAAMRVAGVSAAEGWLGARAALSRSDGSMGNAFSITAPPAGSPRIAISVERGRWLSGAAGTNELVVNRRMLETEPAMDVGREVVLVISGRRSSWTVVGIAETGPSPQVYAARETLGRVTEIGGATAIVVVAAVQGAAAQLELIQRVRAELTQSGFEVLSGQLMAQQRAVVEDHLLMVAGFLGSMSLLMIVVGGLGLASTMSLAVLERTREIGVMRAIGARHGAILTMVQVEGLVVAVLSWIIALPLSIPMSVALGNAFGRIMLQVPVTLVPELTGVLRWFAVVVVVSILACAWPAFRATRVTTSAALAYE